MTDKLLNMAQADQADHPIDEGDDVETVELDSENPSLDDPEADKAEDTASKRKATEEIE